MSVEGNGNQNPQSAKVLKLGLNISVTGDPGTDFEVFLDENKTNSAQSSLKNETQHQSSDLSELEEGGSSASKNELEKGSAQDVNSQSTGALPKQRENKTMNPSASPSLSEAEKEESKDSNIIERIKTTMEHFEKFSDHIKEIPRLRNHPIATSTPFSDKQNSRSESSLVHSGYRPGKFAHLQEFQSRKNYFKGSIKPLPSDLFLKPLPGENLYKRGIYSRYFDLEPYRHYGSDNSLNRTSDYKSMYGNAKSDVERYDPDQPTGILKKSDSESGDKQSTSSADSIKDIKIYQSGGILIMQNFKDGLDPLEKRELSEFSVKLIENCNKLKDEISSFRLDKPFIESASEENKNSGKTVQFDLTSGDSQKSASGDLSCAAVKDENSFLRLESSESTSDCLKTKDTSPQGTSQSQDFPSLSTQENDSIVSNQPGTSPTFVSPKKLEWDSGADIGYMNLDLTKENLSTIERIVLKGLSSDGLSEKNVVYEKTPELNQTSRSKFILERIPSDLVIEEITNEKRNRESVPTSDSSNKEKETEQLLRSQRGSEGRKTKERTEKKNGGGAAKEGSRGESRLKKKEPKPSLEGDRANKPYKVTVKAKRTTDKSVNVNTLWGDASCETSHGQSTGTESSRQIEHETNVRSRKFSPKVRKAKKKRPAVHRTVPLTDRTDSQVERRSKSCTDASLDMGLPEKNEKNVEALPVLNDAELSREVEEMVVDQRYKNSQSEEGKAVEKAEAPEASTGDRGEHKADGKVKSRPISASSGSNRTVLPKAVEEPAVAENKFVNQLIQTNNFECESVGIQAFASQLSSECETKSHRRREETKGGRQSSKNIQAFGLNASLPKQLEHPKESTESIANQNTKSTQFFGGPVNSLPNYHSNLVTKPGESCGRAPQVLKAKKNLEAEIIRLKEENEKNILANDVPPLADPKSDSRKRSSNENKENLIKKSSKKKIQSNTSRKTSKGSGSQESERKEKAKSIEGSEGLHTSDEVSSLVLTSEVLKVHGDSIDRNIIQEKYFQSQLAEYQARKMVTRSTSMELQTEGDGMGDACRKYTSTGCQYSPQSKDTNQDNDSSKGKAKSQERETSEQYDSSQNVAEDCFETVKSTANQGHGLGGGDSLPSSTQTAHSWVPGMQNSGGNASGVGRARSFEYLPGHIYESSGNLREELPSETEQNLITSGSSDSDTAKRSLSDRARESEEGGKCCEMEVLNNVSSSGKECGDTPSELSGEQRKGEKEKEISIACQTEGKSSSSEPEKFYEGRKALEKRISEEKKCQIEWIEKEIYHLNVLRGLLEKQNSGRLRRKKNSTSNEGSKSEVEDVSVEVHPRPMTPVFGCTISVTENVPNNQQPESQTRDRTQGPSQGCGGSSEKPDQYGVAVALSGKDQSKQWRRVLMLPVGVQVSLKDRNFLQERGFEETNGEDWSESFAQENAGPRYEACRYGGVHQSDVNTQYPSGGRRTSGNYLSTSVQTSFSPPGRCAECNEENCVCLHLEKCYSSFSRSSKSRTSERRGSSKLTSLCEEPELGNENGNEIQNRLTHPGGENHKRYNENGSDSSLSHSRPKSGHGPNCKCSAIVQSTPDMPENYEKRKHTKKPNHRCQNSPVQVSSSISRSDCQCGQSNIYLNIDKSAADFGACRCCKFQPQKPSKSSCHIIKIHGPKCCSSGKGSCCCKSRPKNTEDQSCQTDLDKVVSSEEGNWQLRFEAVGNASHERRKHPEQCSCCACGSKKAKEKNKVDDHPRHYFLKILETEVDDDPKELPEQKKSLEVITVTVPVKKAGKAKIYNKVPVASYQDSGNEFPLKGCNCCAECIAHRLKSAQEYESRMMEGTRSVAEKPESPRRDCESTLKESELRSCESENYGGVANPSKELYEEISSRECYPDKSIAFDRREAYDLNGRGSGNQESQCWDGCKCMRRSGMGGNAEEVQSEYDSHKKSRGGNGREHQREGRTHESLGNWGSRERAVDDVIGGRNIEGWSSQQRKSQSFDREDARCNYDYYNYNKPEFMTKSELLKEEEQKQKVQQPSLQEYLTSNRPDFYSSAERRRQMISERTKERVKKHSNRMECLIDLIHRCNERERVTNEGPKRIFTTTQMREQTMKRYKKLPEVTGKLADRKKKEEYRTNKLMADIFAKKLQSEALKGVVKKWFSETTDRPKDYHLDKLSEFFRPPNELMEGRFSDGWWKLQTLPCSSSVGSAPPRPIEGGCSEGEGHTREEELAVLSPINGREKETKATITVNYFNFPSACSFYFFLFF